MAPWSRRGESATASGLTRSAVSPSDFRRFRSALGLSGTELARLVGAADGRTVRKWCAGTNDIPTPVVQLVRLLQALDDHDLARAVKMLMEIQPD